MKKYLVPILLAIFIISCTRTGEKTFISADDPNIAFIGRFDLSDSRRPVFMYSGCNIRTVFKGTSVEMIMKDDSMRNAFNVIIDDSLFIITTNSTDSNYLLAQGLQNRKHTLNIIRRTEWHGGNTAFIGFKVDKGKVLYRPEIKEHKLEFIGNSYTCGYGNEGKSREEHFAYETENNYMTYGAIAARALDAEYLTVCRSGIGIWQGYGGGKDFTMPKFYDEVILGSTKGWDFSQYQPQLVVIDLGGNDLSVELDSVKFISTYVEFLGRIRKNYPAARIICAAGPSTPGTEWQKWQRYLHAVVEQFGKQDSQVYYFEFSTFKPNGSDWHPNVAEHSRMADELIPYIRELMRW